MPIKVGNFDIRQIPGGGTHDRSEALTTGRAMPVLPAESLFLVLVILALTTFGVVLAVVSWSERFWARKHGR